MLETILLFGYLCSLQSQPESISETLRFWNAHTGTLCYKHCNQIENIKHLQSRTWVHLCRGIATKIRTLRDTFGLSTTMKQGLKSSKILAPLILWLLNGYTAALKLLHNEANAKSSKSVGLSHSATQLLLSCFKRPDPLWHFWSLSFVETHAKILKNIESLGYTAALQLLQKAGPSVILLVSQLGWSSS